MPLVTAGFVEGCEKKTLPTRSRRLRTPVFSNMLLRCSCTVWGETTRRSAISLVDAACRTSRVTSCSRSVTPSDQEPDWDHVAAVGAANGCELLA